MRSDQLLTLKVAAHVMIMLQAGSQRLITKMVLFLLGTRARVAFLADGGFLACLRILPALHFLKRI